MKLITLIPFLSLLLLSTGFAHHAPAPLPSSTPAVVAALPSPAPTATTHVDPLSPTITLDCDSTCLPNEVAQLPALQAKMNEVLNSDCLSAYFLTPHRRIDNRDDLTPEQVLLKLRQPSHLTLNYFYKSGTKEEGYESAVDFSVIHMNRAYTATWTLCEVTSLGLHEMTHTKQFWHPGGFNQAKKDYFTVPYQANNATEGRDNMSACCQ